MEELSYRWFSLFYLTLGTILITGSVYLWIRKSYVVSYLIAASESEKPPRFFVNSLKYLLLFTIPCLIFSFFPFSWPELIFSVWCFIIIYTSGQMLAYWKHTAVAIKENKEVLPRRINFISANMLSIGIIMFLLYYFLQTRAVG